MTCNICKRDETYQDDIARFCDTHAPIVTEDRPMKFVGNALDPRGKTKQYILKRLHPDGVTEEEYQDFMLWIEDKTLKEPRAMRGYSIERLKEMGLCGVYVNY